MNAITDKHAAHGNRAAASAHNDTPADVQQSPTSEPYSAIARWMRVTNHGRAYRRRYGTR